MTVACYLAMELTALMAHHSEDCMETADASVERLSSLSEIPC